MTSADRKRERERKEIEKFVIEKLASGERPPWETPSPRLRTWLLNWTVMELDRRETAARAERGAVDFGTEMRLVTAIGAAERGNVTLLRELENKIFSEKYGAEFAPQLAGLVNPPRPRKRRSKHPFPAMADWDDHMLQLACGYVYKIEDLWVETYDKKLRPDEPTALSIAAVISGFDEDRIALRLKKVPRPTPMKKVPARAARR